MVAALGQITDGGHVLVIPKRHLLCMGEIRETSSLNHFVTRVRHAVTWGYGKNNGRDQPFFSTMMFEDASQRGSTNHACFHIVPTSLKIEDAFFDRYPCMTPKKMRPRETLQSIFQGRPYPYLYWAYDYGQRMILWDPPPTVQSLRKVVATLHGCPERGDWRTVNPADDEVLWRRTTARLKAYFV